jgi:hypothetical protein
MENFLDRELSFFGQQIVTQSYLIDTIDFGSSASDQLLKFYLIHEVPTVMRVGFRSHNILFQKEIKLLIEDAENKTNKFVGIYENEKSNNSSKHSLQGIEKINSKLTEVMSTAKKKNITKIIKDTDQKVTVNR